MNQGTWEFGSSCAALSKKGRAAAVPTRCRSRMPSLIRSLALGTGAETATAAVAAASGAPAAAVAPLAGALSDFCAGSIAALPINTDRTLRNSRPNSPLALRRLLTDHAPSQPLAAGPSPPEPGQ